MQPFLSPPPVGFAGKLKERCNMRQTIQMGQVQPSVLSVEGIVKNCKMWLGAKSKTFSSLCGEDVTHKEVIIAHAALMLLIVVCGVAAWLEGGVL